MKNFQTDLEGLDEETIEDWKNSLNEIFAIYGEKGVRNILATLEVHAASKGILSQKDTLNTPYLNSIASFEQPVYPGNLVIERRIENILRWNAMAMVLQGFDSGSGVGGHIATYSSASTMLEVGFNHFFRGISEDYGGDIVIPQPHASPGIYARAFLEGRISENTVKNFRRELQPDGGLSSYPHPYSMPDFWQVPCASMGLSTPTAIYQARFIKYLENRGLKKINGGKIWCFIGDGEADEPEVLGTIGIAAREKLDNLILVVNCNLQRLDGPVRGNGKIIQELESSFLGAGWNVIKVIWGGEWDALLERDEQGVLKARMEQTIDGDYQWYSASSGTIQREHWVQGNPELEKIMSFLSDEDIQSIKRGGHDPEKIYSAFEKAVASKDKPTVILVKTVKGDGLGEIQGLNTAHQKKNLKEEVRVALAKEYQIPLSQSEIAQAALYRPLENSEELTYLRNRRESLGGYLPSRTVKCQSLEVPPLEAFRKFLNGSGGRKKSTTMSAVRVINFLTKNESIGKYIVPIVPDEARTFGLENLINSSGIYSIDGQNYQTVDNSPLLAYREAKDGQILQEGICETGAIASFLAAGTAYAMHGIPMIPFYFFYSMFGFQRVGDMIWACGDMMCRGFLLGGTAGRTTLNGEGLQHQDGHSHVFAETIPNLKSYDPAFSFELAIIIWDGLRRMYSNQENLFYYITLYNETYEMPLAPKMIEGDLKNGILKGMYRYRKSNKSEGVRKAHILASGPMMNQALDAQIRLENLGICADVWSVTSFNELYRDALEGDRKRMKDSEYSESSHIEDCLKNEEGVFVAVTDYQKSLSAKLAKWIPGPFAILGTDGFGLSESREELRDYFEVSADYIVLSVLVSLNEDGLIEDKVVSMFRSKLR